MTAGAVSHPLEAFGADDAGVVHRGSDWGDRGQVPAGSGEKTARSGSAGREAPEEEEREIAAAAGGGRRGKTLKSSLPTDQLGTPRQNGTPFRPTTPEGPMDMGLFI